MNQKKIWAFPDRCVSYEFASAKRDFSKPGDIFNIERLKNRIYADPVPMLKDISEIHRFSIYQDKIYFCVRHTERLDHIFYGSSPFEIYLKVGLSPLFWQKIV
jgi:hypothetical protein